MVDRVSEGELGRLRALEEEADLLLVGHPDPGVDLDRLGADERGYHATAPFVFGQSLRREALVCLRAVGIPVKYGHSEVGYVEPAKVGDLIWEQHEIELDLLPLTDAADAIVLTQWVLRNLAHEHGLQCNTDPLVAQKHAGNGLHVHFALQPAAPNVVT